MVLFDTAEMQPFDGPVLIEVETREGHGELEPVGKSYLHELLLFMHRFLYILKALNSFGFPQAFIDFTALFDIHD
jgi:hypothetical protein